jgi:hypothetical protein
MSVSKRVGSASDEATSSGARRGTSTTLTAQTASNATSASRPRANHADTPTMPTAQISSQSP